MSKLHNAKPGCFPGFLHTLLCNENGNSPPLNPFDHTSESRETEIVHPKKGANAMANSATPGLIARLMGLDSLPNTNLVSKGTTPGSVPRSRSVNFVDYMLKFDISETNHSQVKTSSSFREVPKLLQQKNHGLLVLHWDSGSGSGSNKDQKFGSNLRKQEMGLRESRQRKKKGSKNKEIERENVTTMNKERNQGKNKKISKLKNEPRMDPAKKSSKVQRNKDAKVLASVSSCSKSSGYRRSGSGSCPSSASQNKKKKVFSEPKQTKNMRKQRPPKKIGTEFSSENLSPVSVLDINDYSYLYGPDFLDFTSPLMSKSKWESSKQHVFGDSVEEDTACKNKGYDAYDDVVRLREYFSELELKLRTLTENDIRESNYTQTQALEELCSLYEHTIFDILLNELVNELDKK